MISRRDIVIKWLNERISFGIFIALCFANLVLVSCDEKLPHSYFSTDDSNKLSVLVRPRELLNYFRIIGLSWF